MVGEQPLVSAEVIIFTLHQNLTNTCYVCEHYFFSLLKSIFPDDFLYPLSSICRQSSNCKQKQIKFSLLLKLSAVTPGYLNPALNNPVLIITAVPREIQDNGYAKFWGLNKVHYGLCENGE